MAFKPTYLFENGSVKSIGGMLKRKYKPHKSLESVIEDSKTYTMSDLYDGFHSNVKETARFREINRNKILEPRYIKDSKLSVMIPLSVNLDLRNKYSNHLGEVRLGRLMEDMDILAPCCCYMHNRESNDTWFDRSGTLPRTVVTARLHNAELLNAPFNAFDDIYLNGNISWTNKTTMEATVTATQDFHKYLTLRFVMVSLLARDLQQKCDVHQLRPSSSAEQSEIALRNTANTAKPNAIQEQQDLTYVIEKLLIVYPEFQNPYGSAFGGFLLREGLEVAEAAAQLHFKREVSVRSLDVAQFLSVVPIGSMLRYRASIEKNDVETIMICVRAEVVDTKTGLTKTTNKFKFTFAKKA